MQSKSEQDDLDAWLAEVDLVHDKIKQLADNTVTVKEIDEQFTKQNILKQKELDAKQDKLLKQQKAQQTLEIEGRRGKGEKQNYDSFCKYCHIEYIVPKPECHYCKRPTQTYEQRYNDLLNKVQVYKEDKYRKQDRKQKFELMQKTSKILWKKNSTNYSKWEYYTSSEEELQNVDPIVPKDDPQFKALEMDMEERKKKREECARQAEILKIKGNEYFSNGQYDHAVMKYSQALELIKDVKAIWLNRALAYIKLDKFRKAAKDCTRVLDYAECFENGYTVSRASCSKAFLRRALAYKNLKRFDEALADANQALILDVKDKEGIQLKQEIESLLAHQQTIDKAGAGAEQNVPFKEIIDKFITGQRGNDILLLMMNAFRQNSELCKAYFYEKGAIQYIIALIQDQEELNQQTAVQSYSFNFPVSVLQLFLEDNPMYLENFIVKWQGIEVLSDKIKWLMKQAQQHKNPSIYDNVQDCLDVLNMLENEKIRNLAQKNTKLTNTLYPELFNEILGLYKSERSLVNSFLSLCTNLCYGPSELKQVFQNSHLDVMTKLSPIIESIEPIPSNQSVYNSICNLLSNFLVEPSFRMILLSKECETLIFKKLKYLLSTDMNQENCLAVFVNLTYKANQQQQDYIMNLNIVPILLSKLNVQNKLVVERSITVLSKTTYCENIYVLTPLITEYSQSLKALSQMVTIAPKEQLLAQLQKTDELFELLGNLRKLLHKDEELWFCNACNVIGQLVDASPLEPKLNNENPSSFFRQVIPRLITIVRDKLGNLRKNAAILTAKLSKDEDNLQAIRDLHGIEILNSVIGHMNLKK